MKIHQKGQFLPRKPGVQYKCWSKRDSSKQTTETPRIRLLLWIILCEQQRDTSKNMLPRLNFCLTPVVGPDLHLCR